MMVFVAVLSLIAALAVNSNTTTSSDVSSASSADAVLTMACKDKQVQSVPITAPWEHLTFFPFKRESSYSMYTCDSDNQLIVRVDASQSASMLKSSTSVVIEPSHQLQWSWKVLDAKASIDTNNPKREDAPVRIVLAFDGDRQNLPEEEQSFLSQMDWVTGRKAPYASLMYIVGGKAPTGEFVASRHSDTIRFLVLQRVEDKNVIGQWHTFERNVYEDYKQAFGKAPGALIGIGIMGDMDNTGGSSVAYVKNLELKQAVGKP